MPGYDDKTLCRQVALDHDKQAFRQLMERYSPRLHVYARTYVRQGLVAEEVVAEVWVKCWRNRATLDQVSYLPAYLFKAVRHQALNYGKQEARHHPEMEAILPPTGTLVDPGDPLREMEYHELVSALDVALGHLPTGSREAFRLVRQEGLSYQAAADELGISVNTLKTQLTRALKKLRTELSRYLMFSLFI